MINGGDLLGPKDRQCDTTVMNLRYYLKTKVKRR